jgi:hypothetical protein
VASSDEPSVSSRPGVLLRRRLLVLSAAVVIGLAVIRLATGGWESMGSDQARYVSSGMSLLDGRGYVNEGGETYLLRAPAYPLILGGAFALAGADAAHLAAWCLGLGGLVLAMALAARLGGTVASLATTAAVIAVPLFWEQVVSLGIDLPHAAFYLAAIFLLGQPKPGHWLAAGGLLGVALLIKETLAPAVVLLPIAWFPVWSGLTWRSWARLALLFLFAAALVAGWWWWHVWRETGLLFPLNALAAIVPDEAALSVSPTPAIAIAGLGIGAAWVYLLVMRVRDAGVRLLAFATIALLPAVAATVALAQPMRNLTALVLLSCVALGVALADVWRKRSPRLPAGARRAGTAAVAIVLIAGMTTGQLSVANASPDPLPADAAAFLRQRVLAGQDVISSFRYRSPLGVELFDAQVDVRLMPVRPVARAADPSQFLWLGERRGTLFGLTRDNWRRVLGSPSAAYLVVSAPHPLSPVELLPALRSRDERPAGLTYIEQLSGPTGTVDMFAITPDRIDRATRIRLHAQPGALVHWLDIAQAAGATDPGRTLLDARPVVLAGASELNDLAQRLGAGACFRPRTEDGESVLLLEPAAGQGDCLSKSDLRID